MQQPDTKSQDATILRDKNLTRTKSLRLELSMSYLPVDKDGKVTKRILKEGEPDEQPVNGQLVAVHYVGTIDETGEEFDTSKLFGDSDYSKPLSFRIGGGMVVPGFDVAVRSMTLGEACHVHIAAELAYGAEGSPARGMMPEIPPNANISFHLELMSIGADESKTKAAKDRLELARAERDAAAAERLAAQKEKDEANEKRQAERAAKKASKKSKEAAPSTGELDKKAIKKMNPKQLKAELKSRGASVIGNKKELCARLLELAL